MAELFKNKSKMYSKPNNLETKYNSSIANLLLVVVFSAVNIVMLLVNADTYFLFSAFLPYFAVDYGMFLCGMYPEEYYYDMPDTTFEDKSFLGLYIAIAAAFLLAYLLCWYLAKKKKIGAVILALVMFLIDTAAMLWLTGFVMDSIIDILMHIWVISYLVIGIVTYFKIKKAPQEELCDTDGCCEAEDEATDVDGNSKVWVNTIWGSQCGYLDDDAAFENGPEEYYGKVVDMGATIIQTDRPEFLISYLRSRGLHD
jgi:glycerophosphoryl diester phosphodiesterase